MLLPRLRHPTLDALRRLAEVACHQRLLEFLPLRRRQRHDLGARAPAHGGSNMGPGPGPGARPQAWRGGASHLEIQRVHVNPGAASSGAPGLRRASEGGIS